MVWKMSNNLCNEPGKKSVRLNDKDVEKAEDLGLDDVSASTVFSELLDRAKQLKKIRDEKRKEHVDIRQELESERQLYGLE